MNMTQLLFLLFLGDSRPILIVQWCKSCKSFIVIFILLLFFTNHANSLTHSPTHPLTHQTTYSSTNHHSPYHLLIHERTHSFTFFFFFHSLLNSVTHFLTQCRVVSQRHRTLFSTMPTHSVYNQQTNQSLIRSLPLIH